MPVKNFYLLGTRHATAQAGAMQEDGVAPATAVLSPPTGWVVAANGSGNMATIVAGQERPASAFTTALAPDNIAADFQDRGYTTPTPLTGIIPAGTNITFAVGLRNGNGGGNTADGAIRSRLVAITDPVSMAGARYVVGTTQVGSALVNIGTATQISTVSFVPASDILLQNEHLYWQIAWRINGAASAGNDLNLVGGSSILTLTLDPLAAPTEADLVGMVCG